MGQKKIKDAERIAELEKELALADEELREAGEALANIERDLRVATTDLNAYRAEARHQREIADKAKREAERQAERERLEALSNGVVDLSKIKHDLGFDYDADADGGTVTITLHANAREAKILNAYATQDSKPESWRAVIGVR